MSFTNPILPGFYPDPSICRVGTDFYLATSSFEYFPGVPVFHSRDLVHWRQIGHALDRPSQLPLAHAVSSGGILAPTIRHHQDRFYLVTTNFTAGRHLLVHATDPAGPWSEPLWLGHDGIDPSLFFDDDGRVFFCCTGPGGIQQAELDLAAGRFVSDWRLLWGGTGGSFPEAPHLYKINGVYYLMLAEGGTEYGHMVTIARAAGPWGPFEPCPRNPILSHRSRALDLRSTGHGDLAQDHAGNWWIVFLGVRPVGYPPCHHLGRETCLAPVTWDAAGWPVVNQNQPVQLLMHTPALPAAPWPATPSRDDFDAPRLAFQWNFLRNPSADDWSLTTRPGHLRLRGSAFTLDDFESPAFIGRRQQHFHARAAARLDFTPTAPNEEAGLPVLMNNRHHYEIGVTLKDGRRCAQVRRRIGSLSAIVANEPIPNGALILAISADPNWYTFTVEDAAGVRRELARAETRYLSTEVAGGFTGVYLGMYATGNGAPARAAADFDWFEYTNENPGTPSARPE